MNLSKLATTVLLVLTTVSIGIAQVERYASITELQKDVLLTVKEEVTIPARGSKVALSQHKDYACTCDLVVTPTNQTRILRKGRHLTVEAVEYRNYFRVHEVHEYTIQLKDTKDYLSFTCEGIKPNVNALNHFIEVPMLLAQEY